MTPKQKIADKISKLLALAEDQDGTPEGERAAEIAERLMREHAITMAEVMRRGGEEEKVKVHTFEVPRSEWRRQLLWVLSRHTGCKTLLRTGWNGGDMIAYGYAHELSLLEYLFDVCQRDIDQGTRAHLARLKEQGTWWGGRHDSGSLRAEGNSFRRSAVEGLRAKLREMRKQARAGDDKGTALVLAREAQVAKVYRARNPNLGTHKGTRFALNSAGYQHGQSMSVNPGIGAKGGGSRVGRTRRIGGE